MSWSTRITSAPMCSGIRAMTWPRCSVSSSGSPAAGSSSSDDPRLADDGPRDLDEPPLRARPGCRPWRRDRRRGRRTSSAPSTSSRRVPRVSELRVLPAPARRCRGPRAPRSPARSGTCAAGPSARGGSAACASRSSPKAHDRSARRRHEAGQHVEERRLAGAVGADQPARAASNVTVMPSSGRTPPNSTVRSVISITRGPRSDAARSRRSPSRAPSLARSLRHLRREPGRGRGQHLQHADAEQDRQQVGGKPPVVEQRGQQLHQRRGDDRAPDAVDPAHQHDGEQHDRLAGRELVDVQLARRCPPAGRRRRR